MNDPIRSTTQKHLDIEDISHNLVLFKDGSACIVIRVSAVNFDLLSEEEQDSIIYSYASLLNSLSFKIQILIRSEKKDISNYVKVVKDQEAKQLNPIIKSRLTAYREFVEKIVKERNVLDKKFYVAVPFSRIELGLSQGINPLDINKSTELPYDKSYIIQKALNSLEPKRDHLLRQFTHLNLSPKQLSTQELIKLFYAIYNPDSAEGVQLANPVQYSTPLTQSSRPLKPAATANPNQQTPNPK